MYGGLAMKRILVALDRTAASRTVLAGGTRVLRDGDFGRRPVTRAGPGGQLQPVASRRPVAPQRGTALGPQRMLPAVQP